MNDFITISNKLQDMFKLKLLNFYYKLSYDLLPSYFQTYREADKYDTILEK